ncbi:unnamed protein product [Vicia faba]|uniref:Uncharacterized protein n=1 Tax=Vicia faba TaxID=3906 RepID=A0AAV0ZAJ5_VICFA|nr:unnamed protein product [Vicia faba]
MLQAGIIDPHEFPLTLDAMLSKKFAFKQSPLKLDTSNSMQILESVGEDLKCEQLNSVAVLLYPDYYIFYSTHFANLGHYVISDTLQEGEITSPHVPDPTTPKDNVKRMSPDSFINSYVNHIIEGDLSSTKLKKVTKQGKKTDV